MIIRPAKPADRKHLRRAIVELQDHERQLHVSRLPGEQTADAYLDWLLRQPGSILVAESGGEFAGFVAARIETTTHLGETADSNRFGLISDVCVMPEFRGQGTARRLLDLADSDLRRGGVTRVRVTALANNAAARASYARAGFLPYEVVYEKTMRPERNPAIVREATSLDREWIGNLLRERWHDTLIAAHGQIIDAAQLPALVVDDRRGLATWRRLGHDAELMTLDAVPAGIGIGTALIRALATLLRTEGCARLCLTTTNDNLSALRFYMRRGFRITALRPGAVDEARRQKPSIPLVGRHGIPIHDELELCLALD